MPPPYDPQHHEMVLARGPFVQAYCSCTGPLGPERRPEVRGTCRELITDFNDHRSTYAREAS